MERIEQLRQQVKSILALDIDGTLTKPTESEFANKETLKIIRNVHEMGHIAVPVTGKSLKYAEGLFSPNEIESSGIIAENGAVYRLPGQSGFTIFGGNIEALEEFKEILCLHKQTLLEESERVEKGGEKIIIKTPEAEKEKIIKELPTVINFKTRKGEPACVCVEGGKYGVLTLFTEAALNVDGSVRHESNLDTKKLEGIKNRWPDFRSNATRDEVYEHLQEVIKKHNLEKKLFILPPHPDGAIDIVRIDEKTGKPIDKSLLPIIAKEMYGDVPVAMFGDGENDIPALEAEGVYAITFSNVTEKVRQCVEKKGAFGFISPSGAPEDMGVAEGIYWLAKNKFFGDDSEVIIENIKEIKPEIIENVELQKVKMRETKEFRKFH